MLHAIHTIAGIVTAIASLAALAGFSAPLAGMHAFQHTGYFNFHPYTLLYIATGIPAAIAFLAID